MSHDADAIESLLTVRDWLRHATSRFNAAGLVYGHGTETAIDEAAFLILSTLELPIDSLEPWLDARLTRAERQRISTIVNARISTRKPAPYLTGTAWIRGHRFHVDGRVIVPRSFIGELLADAIAVGECDAVGHPLGITPGSVNKVLDLCTGGGSLAILVALAFPDAHIDAVDLSAGALEVAKKNVAAYDLAERIALVQSDLFAGLAGRRYDLIVSNPPYVTDASLAAFPPEYQAEPRLAHAGGSDGLDVVHRILALAPQHLESGGALVVEIGQAREELLRAYPKLPFLWLDTAASEGEVFSLLAGDLASVRQPKSKPRRS